MAEIIAFPRQNTSSLVTGVFKRAPCPHCGVITAASLQRYPLNRAVAWRGVTCNALIRSHGRLFIPHHELRSCGIDPDCLPGVVR
jgi:hypothetical protein